MKVLFNEKSYGKTVTAIDQDKVTTRALLRLLWYSFQVSQRFVVTFITLHSDYLSQCVRIWKLIFVKYIIVQLLPPTTSLDGVELLNL